MWFRFIMVVLFIFAIGLVLNSIPIPHKSSAPVVEQKASSPTPGAQTLIHQPEESPSVAFSDVSSKHFGAWLFQQGFDLNPQVLEILESILNYATANQIEHNHILTLIDYSIPANQKRLWVFDLLAHRVLFHTYVSHGIKSGNLNTVFFSNHFDSKASSIGVYRTEGPYYGRHGLSLKLNGLDQGFNDNAESRAIVMHGGWYVEEAFIQKYGRAGRSWGCPAVPDQFTTPIINTIKDKSLFVIYYPSSEWFTKSRFLHRNPNEFLIKNDYHAIDATATNSENQDDVLLAQVQKKHKYQETEAILVMPAEKYTLTFQTKAPLNRMLRRQIEDQEYIALSKTELDHLLGVNPKTSTTFQDIYFVLPEIKMVRGYYATEMYKINLGKITEVQPSNTLTPTDSTHYTVHFSDHSSLSLKTTHRFIRWLGL